MKTILFTLASLLLLSLAGCEKETLTSKNETLTPQLVGKWEWVRSIGGLAGSIKTPQTIGYTYDVAFTMEGDYQVYDKNNRLVSTDPYSIRQRNSIYDGKEHDMIVLDDYLWSSFEFRRDTLILSEEVYDGYTTMFVRK